MVREEYNNTISLRGPARKEKNLNGEYLVIRKQEKRRQKKRPKKEKEKKNWSWLLPVQKSWIHHIPPHNKPICGCLIGGSPSCPAGGSRYVVEMPAPIFLVHFCKGKMGILALRCAWIC